MDAALQNEYRSWLHAEELQRYHRFRFARHRWQYLRTRALEKTLLSRHTGIDRRRLPLARDAHGKPRLSGEAAWLRYNLSHSDSWVAMALCSAGEVGVDVESHQRDIEVEALARSFFHAKEQSALRACETPTAMRHLFISLWTLKEARIKARGLGLAQDLRATWFQLEEDGGIHAGGRQHAQDCLALLRLDKSHLLALCAPRGIQRLSVWRTLPLVYEEPLRLDLLAFSHDHPKWSLTV